MQLHLTSRRLAGLAMLALAALSCSALAAWMVPPPALIAGADPEPAPLLLLGVVLVALGWHFRPNQRGTHCDIAPDDGLAPSNTGGQ